MIHRTVTFVAITTFHLAVGTFTMDLYRPDAAIWSQTETTTDWQVQSSGTAYQQMTATENIEIFTTVASTVHNKLDASLDNLVSAFNTSSYIGDCSIPSNHTDAHKLQYISYNGVFTQELTRMAWELYGKFKTLTETALYFICTGNETVGHDVIPTARIYVNNFTEFIVRLNSSTEAIGEVAVLDTVADLYRTSIEYVESVMEVVEHLTEMISEEDKIGAMKRIILQQMEAVDKFYEYSLFEIIVGKQKELVTLLQNTSERAGNMSEHTEGNPFINIITSGKIWRFVDAQYWAKYLEEESQVLAYYQTWLLESQYIRFVVYKLTPVVMAIVLVVGMTSNGLLLTIFVRHKETRTVANSMLINLTVVDFLSLVVNLLLDYLRLIKRWNLGSMGCKLYIFFAYLIISVSIYSVVMISVQRFVAVAQLPSLAWCHHSQKTKYVLIATVWGIGCILCMHHAVFTVIDSTIETCYELPYKNLGTMDILDLITVCVVPLLITAVFSGLTAYRIRRSARDIPGEATGQQQLKHSRMVSSNVLFALTVLFVVSNVPFYLFPVLISLADIRLTNWTSASVKVVTYFLRFVNCCLNPIVLLVMSKRYRGYIKGFCGQREV